MTFDFFPQSLHAFEFFFTKKKTLGTTLHIDYYYYYYFVAENSPKKENTHYNGVDLWNKWNIKSFVSPLPMASRG